MLDVSMMIGIFCVGICFTGLGLMILWRNRVVEQQGIKIYGRVIEIVQEGKEIYARRYPMIEYQFQGQKRRFKDLLEMRQSSFKLNDNLPIYVFMSHLDSAMSVRFIEKIKGIGYLFTAIGVVTCVVGGGVSGIYFKEGFHVDLALNDPIAYGELFFAIMFIIAVIRAIAMFSDIFAQALKGSPLEKNAYIVTEDQSLPTSD